MISDLVGTRTLNCIKMDRNDSIFYERHCIYHNICMSSYTRFTTYADLNCSVVKPKSPNVVNSAVRADTMVLGHDGFEA